MRTTTERAFGKLNLTLDVLGLRPDGYHEMRMVMQSVALRDELTISVETGRPWQVATDRGDLPDGPENLAWRAAACFEAAVGPLGGVNIHIEKHIPSQAGMTGGSSDAAAVLRGLDRLFGSPMSLPQLARLGEQIGSDVPYCVLGGTMLAEGRGERLTPLPQMPDCFVLLCKPDFSVSTPALFRRIDDFPILMRPDTDAMCGALRCGDLSRIGGALCNVFQPVAAESWPVVDEITNAMLDAGALGAAMTGTGSVVYGLFSSEQAALAAREQMRPAFGTCIVTKTC